MPDDKEVVRITRRDGRQWKLRSDRADWSLNRRRERERWDGTGGPIPAISVAFKVNGRQADLTLDPRVTLLDALRERLATHRVEEGLRPWASAGPARSC
jgi:hypothetical protein